MTMQTFDDAVANFSTPDAATLAALKQTFEPTLADLRDLHRNYPKQKSAWLSRVARIQARQQKALAKGVYHPHVATGLEELTRGWALHGGLLLATENQISQGITNIERLSGRDLPLRNVWRFGTASRKMSVTIWHRLSGSSRSWRTCSKMAGNSSGWLKRSQDNLRPRMY